MSRIYVDNDRKQIVYEDTNENIGKYITYIRDKLICDKSSTSYVKKNLDKYFYYYVMNNQTAFDSHNLSFRCSSKITYRSLLDSIINTSIRYFNKAGLDINYYRYDARIKLYHYSNDSNDTHTISGWSYPQSLNDNNWDHGSGYFTDKIGHVCIFCVKKDSEIIGGDLEFFPRYKEEYSNQHTWLTLGGCTVPYTSLTIPLRTGSVLLLSGSVYHQLSDMKIKSGQEMYLIISEFFYGSRDDDKQ